MSTSRQKAGAPARQQPAQQPAKQSAQQSVQQATALMARITGLNFQLTALAEQAHAMGGLAAGRRALLLDLHRHDALTVPRLADMRPVSRQYVQRLVDDLVQEGHVVAVPNPQHRRSPLYRLTRAGRAFVAHIEAREVPMFERFVQLVGTATIERATAVLDEVAHAVGVIVAEQAGGAGAESSQARAGRVARVATTTGVATAPARPSVATRRTRRKTT